MVAAASYSQDLVWFPIMSGAGVPFSVLFHFRCANRCALDLSQIIIIGIEEIQALVCLNLGLQRLAETLSSSFGV